MTLSQRLWEANQDLADASLHHPFVQGIYTGTLPRSNFAFYVGQDAFFLEAFARAYSIAAAKAPDWSGYLTFHRLASGVMEELKLHTHYARKWDVDLADVTASSATRRYTDFLLATAWSQDVGVTAVAMSPCMRLYAYIGKTLAADGIPDHDYTDWIKTYSSEEFTPLVHQLEALVDEYSQDDSRTEDTFRYAMLCERDFFAAAWEVE